MARRPSAVDGDKLRAAVRKLGREYVLYMLYDAIDPLPPARLLEIAGKYLELERLRPDADSGKKANLLADVKAFEKASRAGEYYESFSINFRSCTQQSAGKTAWIAECNDDVIFFADEGGSRQVGIDWDEVLPPWFKVLSATAAPEEYAERITSVLERHYNHGRDAMLVFARKIAPPDQRTALADAADRQASRRRGGTQP
jgi:hypothetical protein